MTSTSFNVGLKDGRLSSRVLRPPGGGHTDIFGGEPDQPRQQRRQKQNILPPDVPGEPIKNGNGNHIEEEVIQEPTPTPEQPSSLTDETPVIEDQVPETPVTEPMAEEAPVDDIPVEETPVKEPVNEIPKVEPPKRVRVPPGGFSSGLW